MSQAPYLLTGHGCDHLHGSGGSVRAHEHHPGASGTGGRPGDLSTSGAAGPDGSTVPSAAGLDGATTPSAAGLDGATPPGATWPDGSTAPGVAYPEGLAVPGSARLDAPPSLVGARHGDRRRLQRPWARDLSQREAAPKPRRGWYAYRVVGAATLPSWAVEVALTIERPVDPSPEGSASENEGAARLWPASEEPEGARRAATRSPSPESVSPGGRAVPSQQPGPPDPLRVGAQVQAIVLLRAPGAASWLVGIAEAAAEVEAAAGVRRVGDADTVVESVMGGRPRLLTGPPLPGLEPIPAAVALAHLAGAGERGLAAPLRRRRPAAGAAHRSWQATAGSVLTCDGPCGASAQAVVALRGTGLAGAITPPRGGALVLRAWRARRTWGAACGLVLGADQALGLGRAAARVAVSARVAGWDAAVLQGLPALRLARAGDYRQVAPEEAASGASGAWVAELFEAFLAARGLDRPVHSAAFSRALAVTP